MKKVHFLRSLFEKFYLLGFLLTLAVSSVLFISCGDDDGESELDAASAAIKITKVTLGSKRNGQYNYHITVKASGVSSGSVKDIGITWGKTSAATGHRSGTRGALTTTRSINLSANSTYYIKAYVTTSGGTSYTPSKRIKVPK